MTRLMCSTERKEVEELKSKLFRAGIRSEILSNPIAHALGIVRLEIHILESDFVEASRIHQDFVAARNSDFASNGTERGSGNGRAGREEVEVLVEPARLPSAVLQLGPSNPPNESRTGRPNDTGSDLTQAAVLLEKEVEEVLARDQQLAQQSAALQDQVKSLDGSLAQVQTELARVSSIRSATEQKLAEASAARGLLQKELDSANLRLKTIEQSLAATQGRAESQTRELKLQEAKVVELSKEIASRDGQLATLAESLAQTRVALESEKGLRQVTEQKLSEHVAARKSLEQKVDQFAELQAKLQEQYQREREQIQSYLDTVNKLRSRLSQKRTVPPEG